MAYAYRKLDELMGEGSGKQDIFGGQGDPGGMSEFQRPATIPGADQVKTTTEGDLQRNEGVGSEEDMGGGERSAADQTKIFSANVGKTETPQGVYGLRDQIKNNEQALQDKSNEYLQGQKSSYDEAYKLDNSTYDKAIGDSNSEAFGQVSSLLGKDVKTDPQKNFKQFEGADDLYVKDIGKLGSNAGLQNLASQGQGPRYSQGMGAFDVMLMQRDPNFTKLVSEIQSENKGLEEQLGAKPQEVEKKALDYGQATLAGAQTAGRGYLSAADQALIAQNQAERQAYQDELDAIDYDQIWQDEYAKQLAQAQNAAMIGGERYRPYLDKASVNMDDYLTRDDGSSYDYKDFVDQGEADRFNNISSLLGGGGPLYSAAGELKPQYEIDKAGVYRDAYGDIMGARDAQDKIIMAERDRITAAAQQRADADDARRLGLVDSFGSTRDAETDAILKELGQNLAQWYKPEMQAEYNYNPEHAALNTDLDAQHVYSQEEADRLNAIALDLTNTAGTTQAGVGYGGGDLFNRDDYKQFLANKLGGINSYWQGGDDPNTGVVETGLGHVMNDSTGEIVPREEGMMGPALGGQAAIYGPDLGNSYTSYVGSHRLPEDPDAPKLILNQEESTPWWT